jgi:hypothetical protein
MIIFSDHIGHGSRGGAAEEETQQIHLQLSHLSALTSLLQAIKIGSKQVSNSSTGVARSWPVCEDPQPAAHVHRSAA